MLLKKSKNPQYNPVVQEIQNKLNCIKIHIHGNWPTLSQDGLFGDRTEEAVIAFQIYKNITPISGIIGETTYDYIKREYNYIPQLKSSNIHNIQRTNTVNVNQLINSINSFISNQTFEILANIDQTVKKQINVLIETKFSQSEIQNIINKNFRLNSKLKEYQNKVKEIFEIQNKIEQYSSLSIGNTNTILYGRKKDTRKYLEIRNAQSQISQLNKNLKYFQSEAKKLYNECMNRLQKFDISSKIDNMIKKSHQITKSGSLKGGGILTTISLIPLISDLIVFIYTKFVLGMPAIEEWNKLLKNILSLVEGVIIGAVVTFVVGAIGLTGGIAVVVIIVVGLLIGLLIAIFCPEDSLIEYIGKELYKTINSPVFQNSMRI